MLTLCNRLQNIFRPKANRIFLGAIVSVILIFSSQWNLVLFNQTRLMMTDDDVAAEHNTSSSTFKTILLWNGLPGNMGQLLGSGRSPFIRLGCQVNQCFIEDKSKMSKRSIRKLSLQHYDAVLFNMNIIKSRYAFKILIIHHFIHYCLNYFSKKLHRQMRRLKRHLYPDVRFVFLSQEPPMYTWDMSGSNTSQAIDYINFFNWSMSYRRDSDVPFPYGLIRPKSSLISTHIDRSINTNQTTYSIGALNKNESAVVAWMVSHCSTHGRREDYVKQLKHYIAVDVYGSCGKLNCYRNPAVGDSPPECYSELERRYKFYLSFENSICTDYVTEKFFQILKHNMVPVVYGGADYSSIAPPHSYIDARQFKPNELAMYLKMLAANDTLYNEYFWWKEYYEVEAGQEQMVKRGICDLCKKLHQDSSNSEHKIYENILSHWTTDNQCIGVSF